MCTQSFFLFAYIILLLNQIEAPSSSRMVAVAKIRRTQSMRELSHKSEVENPNMQFASPSSSSSTHMDKTLGKESFIEVDLQPLIEKTKWVSIATSVNSNEAPVSTHSDGYIDPAHAFNFCPNEPFSSLPSMVEPSK